MKLFKNFSCIYNNLIKIKKLKLLKKILATIVLTFAIYSSSVLEKKIGYKIAVGVFSLVFIIELFSNELIKSKKNFCYNRSIIVILGFISVFLILLDSKNMVVLSGKLKENIEEILKLPFESYIIIFFVLTGVFIFLLISNCFNWLYDDKKEDDDEERLLSFREEELVHLKELINDKKIQTVLVNSRIGTGKTKIIEELIKRNKEMNVIYLKLPLIEKIEELKENVFLEIKYIFKINGIGNGYINNFLSKVSTFKTGLFEMNLEKKNNWDNIYQLKRSLIELEKEKKEKIIIILDDIEREKDIDKVEKAILFLGELSEYFRNTETTILFLADYDKVIKKIKKNQERIEGLEVDNKEVESFYGKYFKYIFELQVFELKYIKKEDLCNLIRETVFNKKEKEEKEEKEEKYIDFIAIIIKESVLIFSKIEKRKDTIRNLESFLKRIKLLKVQNCNNTTIIISIGIIFLEFFNNDEKNETEKSYISKEEYLLKELYEKIREKTNYVEKNLEYSLIEPEVDKIKKNYKKTPLTLKNVTFTTKLEKINNILEGREEKLNFFEKKIGHYESNYIEGVINGDCQKLNRLLEYDFYISGSCIIGILEKIKNYDLLTENSKEKIKNIFLKDEDNNEVEEEYEDEYDWKREQTESLKEYEKRSINILESIRIFSEDELILVKEKIHLETEEEKKNLLENPMYEL